MKIISFSAKAVYGYMKFDFEFTSNPVILTGPNGSGKTTALRMIQALLAPSIRDLLLIDFAEATIAVNESGKLIVISAKKSKDKLHIYTSEQAESLEVSRSIINDSDLMLVDLKHASDFSRFIKMKYSENPTFKFISELQSPLFLGLDRRNYGFQDEDEVISDAYRRDASQVIRRSPQVKGSLAAGLNEVQLLVRDAYRRVRQLKDQQSERLRKKLLLSGFRYQDVSTDLAPGALGSNSRSLFDVDLFQQKSDIAFALKSIGIDDNEIKKEIDPFFNKVLALQQRFKKISKVEDSRQASEDILEILLNQASLHRLRDMAESVREFNLKSENLLFRFQSFVACINRFFADSKKRIEIDAVGAIKVYRPDDVEVPLSALSSGERQLLVMFGHVFFSSFGNKSNTFVIDEPELSLHLRWQDDLLQEMMLSSSRAQIIVATHSPEIVGDLIDNCVSF